jgi:ferrous iron transport protein B
MHPPADILAGTRRIAIVGNPNSGKSTLFNALTGLRQRVGNYPGVTVEKKEGRIRFDDGTESVVLDLPGAYSLSPGSMDEQITVDILVGDSPYAMPPDLVVCVVNAGNLERNLYLASQIIDLQIPVVIALNMIDVAEAAGIQIRPDMIAAALGVPVIPTVATKGIGIAELRGVMARPPVLPIIGNSIKLPPPVEQELRELADLLKHHHGLSDPVALHRAVHLLSTNDGLGGELPLAPEVADHVKKDRQRLDFLEIDRRGIFVESRYAWIREVTNRAMHGPLAASPSLSDRIDAIVLHRFWGYVIFLVIMGVMFQSVFAWSTPPMEWIGSAFSQTGTWVRGLIPPGDLQSLITDGALAGVSAVVSFLPQILLLFLFIGLFEDTGYMARAAFLMERVMGKVGLHGKSFIPLLSSFACAIPGIMATRTIESPRDRLATMLVAPLMSCSARLPVYTLLIGAFIPNIALFGLVSVPGLTLLSLYAGAMVVALLVAWFFRKTFLKGGSSPFVMELPPYRRPSIRSILFLLRDRAWVFLKQAGTFILGVSILLWFLATYPRLEGAPPSEQLRGSFAGHAGRIIEPVIRPLGFDWKIGIGLISSLLQREVFVSTMGTLYNIQNADDEQGNRSLQTLLQQEKDAGTGKPSFTLLTAICLMVYYAFAMQCLSTVAVMRRETNGWKWPLFQIAYMTALAYAATFVTYRVGLLAGLEG